MPLAHLRFPRRAAGFGSSFRPPLTVLSPPNLLRIAVPSVTSRRVLRCWLPFSPSYPQGRLTIYFGLSSRRFFQREAAAKNEKYHEYEQYSKKSRAARSQLACTLTTIRTLSNSRQSKPVKQLSVKMHRSGKPDAKARERSNGQPSRSHSRLDVVKN